LDFDLKQIGLMLERPDFDPIQALQEHREALGKRIERINLLVETVDNTIARLERERDMDEGKMFTGFSEEDLERYKQEAIQRWGDEEVQSSYKLWDSYSEEQKQKIKAEGNAIYNDLVECLPEGPASAEAQSLIGRWHQNLRCFYKPSIGRMRGLGEMYVSDPKFSARFRELHPNLPEFLRSAIRIYCDDLDRT
jgi:hypothetical protein